MPNDATTTSQATTVTGTPARDTQAFREHARGLGAEPVDRADAWMIALDGEIDAAAVTRLQHEVIDALTGYDRIVIDLSDVSVLSTPTLALLCCALRRAHRPGAALMIADAVPAARRALQLSDLPGVELHPSTTW